MGKAFANEIAHAASFLGSARRRKALRAFGAILALCIAAWAIALVLAIIGAAPLVGDAPSAAESARLAVSLAVYGATLLDGILVLAALVGAHRFLRGIVSGRSPFDSRQVKRMRLLGLILLAYGIIDSFFGTRFFALVIIGIQNLGADPLASLVFDRPWWIPEINVGIFVASLVVFGISFVFEYGCELQQESDSFL